MYICVSLDNPGSMSRCEFPECDNICQHHASHRATPNNVHFGKQLAATLRWFMAGGAIRIAVRQLSQTWKLCHYDVIDDVVTQKL